MYQNVSNVTKYIKMYQFRKFYKCLLLNLSCSFCAWMYFHSKNGFVAAHFGNSEKQKKLFLQFS